MYNNIDPKIWGPICWKLLEYITFTYPVRPTEEDKINIRIFFTALQHVLPCQKCRNNYGMHLKKFPLDDKAVSSQRELITWLINIHNEVNIMNGKPEIFSYSGFIDNMFINSIKEDIKIKEEQKNRNNLITFVLLICLVVVLVIFAKFRN